MAGEYKDFDMTALNLTAVQDYSFYIALKASGQGIGEQVRARIIRFYQYHSKLKSKLWLLIETIWSDKNYKKLVMQFKVFIKPGFTFLLEQQ